MTTIPKIIHQIWSGIDEPLPEYFRQFGETWKENHPDWKYEFWDNDRINSFINKYYPQYWDIYRSFQYDIQRWDAIRYLILDKIGGLYVDFDTECLQAHDCLLQEKTCCFSMEPEKHRLNFKKTVLFNNALMACIPEHPFMKKIIEAVFSYTPKKETFSEESRRMEILNTTGPFILVDTYEKYQEKEQVYLIPPEHVSPLDMSELAQIRRGYERAEFDEKIIKAYSVHYFWGNWWL